MKGRHHQSGTNHSENFISHMVQMKDVYIVFDWNNAFLYIPHGSDESLET